MVQKEACQICGKEAVGVGYVESARVPLCPNCVRYGSRFSVYDEFRPQAPAPKARIQDDTHFVEGFGAKIKAAREQKGWDRAQLGKRLFISETDIRAFEDDRRKPTPAQLEKLERELEVKLVEKDEPAQRKEAGGKMGASVSAPSGQDSAPRQKIEEFTLGDIVTIKKK